MEGCRKPVPGVCLTHRLSVSSSSTLAWPTDWNISSSSSSVLTWPSLTHRLKHIIVSIIRISLTQPDAQTETWYHEFQWLTNKQRNKSLKKKIEGIHTIAWGGGGASFLKNVSLVECMYLVCTLYVPCITRKPGRSYRRQSGSLVLWSLTSFERQLTPFLCWNREPQSPFLKTF